MDQYNECQVICLLQKTTEPNPAQHRKKASAQSPSKCCVVQDTKDQTAENNTELQA